MPNSEDYLHMPDGTFKLGDKKDFPQTSIPMLGCDGWKFPDNKDSIKTHPSPLTPSYKHLHIITAQEAIESAGNGVSPLWSPFIYEQSIVLLSSVAGIGKTTLCYNLALSGIRGDSFADIPFSRPVKVLYADLETNNSLRGTKLKLINGDKDNTNLTFVMDFNFKDDFTAIKDYITDYKIDLFIVDTINEAFRTHDEQDNAEANRQFALVKGLRDSTGCSILLLAHLGKVEQIHRVYASRGASARAASADVVLNLSEISDDVICLSKEKDRIGGGKEKLFLRKAGEDCFEVVEQGEGQEVNLIIRTQHFILDSLVNGNTNTSDFVIQGASKGYSKPTIERALTNLVRARKVDRVRQGVYSLASEKPSITSQYIYENLMESLEEAKRP